MKKTKIVDNPLLDYLLTKRTELEKNIEYCKHNIITNKKGRPMYDVLVRLQIELEVINSVIIDNFQHQYL